MKAKKLLVCSLLALGVLSAPGITQKADAFFGLPLFPPIVPSCGTVEIVDAFIPFPGSDPVNGCKVWRSDKNNRGAFIFAGLESFDPGDRIFVSGSQCIVCLTSCPAVPLLNVTIKDCP